MELYLIRHGIAEEFTGEIKDEQRSLAEQGRKRTQKVAQRLKEVGLNFNLVVTSPLVRAQQTAEILISMGLSSQLEQCSDLAPGGTIEHWIEKWLIPRKYSDSTRLALVGHEPCLSNWAEILIWGEAKGSLVLKKAGTIGIEIPETNSIVGRCQMFWLTPPRYFI
ncbi:MAG: phosphohistidine phosphatase SixA [Rivularia sp. ALOHA_DT_140]|nr:phosphohistidine phosphatase SixA [Rivularia sp. ALOHA_DT_140]